MKKIRKIYQGVSIALVLALVVNLCGCSSVSKTQKIKESNEQPVTEDNSSTVIEKTDADIFAAELQTGFAELEVLYESGESKAEEMASKLKELVKTSEEKLSEFNRNNAETVKSLGSDLLTRRQEAYEREMQENAGRAEKLLEDFCEASNDKEKKQSLKGLKKLFATDPVQTYGSEPENLSEEAQIKTQEVADLDTYLESKQEPSVESDGEGAEAEEFLALSGETALTDRIKEKADELSTPLAVYNYLKNTIDYELYSGSRKGAGQTFDSLAGNDKDQASLMIAMLRYLGYPARYVEGTILLEEDQVKNLTGAKNIRTGADILASAGVPVTIITTDGKMRAVSFEHTWVETYVPYTDYRGAGKHTGERMWISLDSGIQTYKAVDTLTDYIEEAVGEDTWEICLENAEKDQMSAMLEELVAQTAEKEDISDLYVRGRVKEEKNVSYLPLSLQYTVLDRKDTYSEIKDTDADMVEFSIAGEETETFRYSELAGKRITIGYEAETEEDAKALEAYGTVFHAPAYLVRMRPVLKLNGKEVACGEAEALGTDQDFTMTLTSAGKSVEICNFITVGSIYQVTLDGQTITAEELQKSYTEYQKIAETAAMDNVYSDEYLGKILDVAGKLYFAQVDIANLFAAEACGVKATRSLSVGMTGYQAQTSRLYGVPVGIGEGSLFIDVDHDSHGAVSLTGSQAEEKQFMQTSGYLSSLYESTIWEEFTGAEAVSTISIFQAAGEQGTDLLRIQPNNAEAMLQKLNADDATLEEVQNALHAGKEVTITAEAVTIGSWSGYGYIIMDPDSGAAAYMISGGLNGGSGSGVVTLEALLGLALSAVTLSALITDIIGILAVAASLTVFGWVVFAIEIVFLISTVLYMITLCEDYQDYINGDAAAGEKLVNEVMIFAASTLACMCVLKILQAFGIDVCAWINSKMYKPGTGGTGGAGGSSEGNANGTENAGGENAGSGTEGGSGETTAGSEGGSGTSGGESGSKSIDYTYDPKKIGKQMEKRGWTEEAIQETLDNPVRTVKTRDTRWLPGADGPLDDPATAYYASDGSYVVRNDKTGVITQISNKNDPNWIAPWDVED